MEYVTLSNGVKMPKLGFGVFQISKEECEESVINAIKAGYRLIDTAQSYFNEEEVGNAILKCGVPREELFITTKVWISNYGLETTYNSVIKSMKKLKVDYLDLVLLHQPFADYYAAYNDLIKLYNEGKVKAIGVSNFYPDRLADIAVFSKMPPHVNQIEVNPFNQQIEAQENMIKRNVQTEAWAPFAQGKNDIFNNSILKDISNKYNKSVAQVILRWLFQRDIVSLAKSTKIERMKENIDILNFSLSDEDMEQIAQLNTKTSMFFNHNTAEAVDMFKGFNDARKDLI